MAAHHEGVQDELRDSKKTVSKQRPLRLGIIGMGGYAGAHHLAAQALEASGCARLVCACDPAPATFAAQAADWRLRERGVAIHADYRKMLDVHARELDVLAIPTPIPLHEEMHREGVERGLAIYLEKPPTLDPRQLERMIACDRRAPVPTLVGFNFTGESVRQSLKHRLLRGDFGELREVRLLGLWPRPEHYFERNQWAGRLTGADGRLILDSCLGNALSHHVFNALHWAGTGGIDHWASPISVQARAWRAHRIQGADTFFAAAETDAGAPVRIALSHACQGEQRHRETVACDKASLHFVTRSHADIRWRDGRSETITLPHEDHQVRNYRSLFACVLGEQTRPAVTLEDTRPFVHLHALAYIAARTIEDIDPALTRPAPHPRGDGIFKDVRGLAEHAERFLSEGVWPWKQPGDAATPAMLDDLESTVRAMARDDAPLGKPVAC